MCRLIVHILVFSVFSSGMLWAADTHVNDADTAINHTLASMADSSNASSNSHPKPGGHHANHDCHLSAHLTALDSPATSLLSLSPRSENFPHSFTSLISRHSAPPIKPPRV